MGYTFCEFDAQGVVDAHQASVEGVCYKLENLKMRLFECQDCVDERVARDVEKKRQGAIRHEQMKRQQALCHEQMQRK